MVDSRPSGVSHRGRAITPVIGIVLLVAITVLLVGGSAVFFFQLTDDPEPVPETRFEFTYDAGANAVTVSHGSGEILSDTNTGKLVVVVNGADGQDRVTWAADDSGVTDLESDPITYGDDITINGADGAGTGDRSVSVELEQGNTVRLIWISPTGEHSARLATDSVPSLTGGSVGILASGGTVVTGGTAIEGDNGTTVSLPDVSGALVLGSLGDSDGDGATEVPHVQSGGDLRITDSNNQTQTLVDASNVSAATPDTDKSLMATVTWNGTGPSVLYANAGGDAIYRAAAGSGPTEVAEMPSNGVHSVHGVGDIDGDGTVELVYAGSSQTVRYVEVDGSKQSTGYTSTGQNNGIGSGPVTDIDGDGTDESIDVSGSNNVVFVDSGGKEAIPAQSSVSAAKSPVTPADVDDDGDREIVYIDSSSGTLTYIDDVNGTPTVETLTDAGGATVGGDDDVGVVS